MTMQLFQTKRAGLVPHVVLIVLVVVLVGVLPPEPVSATVWAYYDCFCLCQKAMSHGIYRGWDDIDYLLGWWWCDWRRYGCDSFCDDFTDAELEDLAEDLESYGISTEECRHRDRVFESPEPPWEPEPRPEPWRDDPRPGSDESEPRNDNRMFWDECVPDSPFLDPSRPRDIPSEAPPAWLD